MGRKYTIRLDKGLDYTSPALYAPPGSMLYPSKNVRIDQNSAKKRWGYHTAHRSMGAGIDVQHIVDYQLKTGTSATRHTLYLTDTDLCKKETGGSNTFSYKTDTGDYDSSVTNITTDTVTFKASTIAKTENIAVDDKFILDIDHSSSIEPDEHWGTIKTVNTNGDYFTSIVLDDAYTGTTGDHADVDCLIRRVYSIPTDERWVWAIVGDKFCFTNGNTDVQYWDGGAATYAVDLETGLTVARQARYCIEYANRLIIADYGVTRDPLGLAWSAEGDPTTWDSTSAGIVSFLQSADFITGLGEIGTSLFVYKEDSYHVGSRTYVATAPLKFSVHKLGVGLFAPYSLVHFMGTNAFLWRDNFYEIVGLFAQPIGDAIRQFFFKEVTQANVKKVWGFVNELEHELHFIATTTTYGQLDFVYNWFERKWYIHDFHDTLTGFGKGI